MWQITPVPRDGKNYLLLMFSERYSVSSATPIVAHWSSHYERWVPETDIIVNTRAVEDVIGDIIESIDSNLILAWMEIPEMRW